MSLRFSYAMIIFALLIVGCSPSKPAPTQDNGVMLTQAVETAVATILTSQPTASPTAIPETSTPSSTNTPPSTNTPSVTNTPRPPSYEIGITSCKIDTSVNYSGWNIYDCDFWVKSNTNQIITFSDFLAKNGEELKNTYFYEQEDYLKPINGGETGVYVSTADNISYPVDFISYTDTGSSLDILPIRPGVPIRGFEAGISGDGTLNLHFLIPEAMTPDFINFQKIGVKVSIPQSGTEQPVPTPVGITNNAFDYKINNETISLSFNKFDIIDDYGKIYFSIMFDVVNKDKASQTSSKIPFPYFIIDSNGMSYDDVGHGGDKIVEIGPYSIKLGPGQKDELVMKFRIGSIPQYIYIVPTNLNMPIVMIDTNNPPSASVETETTSNTNSGSAQCGNFTSQLQPNTEAKVITDAINMREKSGTTQTVVGVIYQGDKVKILNEPSVCNEGFLWWKVQTVNGITGWAVEGTAEERWLSP